MLCICTRFQSYLADTISLLKFSKGHNSVKNVDGVTILSRVLRILSDDVLICTKFRENASKGFRVIERNSHTDKGE